jgi:small ligand-binding sensory domain FIST
MRAGAGLSTEHDPRIGAEQAARAALAGLDGRACDVALVFASGEGHLSAPEALLEAVHDVLSPAELVGCGAGGVLGSGVEIEHGDGVSVWACALDGEGSVSAFHAFTEDGEVHGVPDMADASGVVILADPFSFPADPVLRHLSSTAPGVPVVGGIASARTLGGTAALFMGPDVIEDGGAVGLRFDAVELIPCVSQGAAPIGPELTITAAEGSVIAELAGKPALDKLREVVEGLPDDERRLLSRGLLLGIVLDANKPDYVHGDFLVRGISGADPDSGVIAVGTDVRPGQVVRVHARDAGSADRDLRESLAGRIAELNGRSPAGALVFSCNGRGTEMFGIPGHDATVVADTLSGAPTAGFFAAGEIGPVGDETFLHGFTATIAVFCR